MILLVHKRYFHLKAKVSGIDKRRKRASSNFFLENPTRIPRLFSRSFFPPSPSRIEVIYEEGLTQAGLFLSIVNSQFTSV